MGEFRFEIVLAAIVLILAAILCLPSRWRELLRFADIAPATVLRIIFWPPSRARYERGLRDAS